MEAADGLGSSQQREKVLYPEGGLGASSLQHPADLLPLAVCLWNMHYDCTAGRMNWFSVLAFSNYLKVMTSYDSAGIQIS
jgi:hypothetical protein